MNARPRISRVLEAVRFGARRALDRIDPNEDETADPLGVLPVIAILAAIGFSVWMYLRWKFQPMQDLGHHLALAAVVADWGSPSSLYTQLYEPIDPIAANSLLYQLAGRLGRFVGVTHAVQACMVFYLAGVPLANLYALRQFGRSAWGALASVPLVYNMNYVAGFANLLFAAPLMVVIVPVFYRTLQRPTRWRTATSAALFVLVFLAHAHAFLWTGAISFVMALCVFATKFIGDDGATARLRDAGATAAAALISVVPSLVLFYRWYRRTFEEGRKAGGVTLETSGWNDHFGADFHSADQLWRDLPGYALKTLGSNEDLRAALLLLMLCLLAVSLSRLHRYREPPVLELVFAATFVAYFFLPEALTGHQVLGSRQIGISMWFISPFLVPVPWRVSRAAHAVVVAGLVVLTQHDLALWHSSLVGFERDEVSGLGEVLAAAPPRLRMHTVKLNTDSAFFTWRVFNHVDKYYMSDSFGQVPDTPGIISTSAIRYRGGIDYHRIASHSPDWPRNQEIWGNFNLVFVHSWRPSPAMLEEAKKHAVLLKRAGEWELWRQKGPWQQALN